MNKGKTNYNFQFNADSNKVNQIILDWLSVNKFQFVNKYGESFYHYLDAWNGSRGFQYNITGNVLNIFVWTIGIGDVFYMLDSAVVNNMAGESYKTLLNSLFSQINEANSFNQSQMVGTVAPTMNSINPQPVVNQTNNQDLSALTKSMADQNDISNCKMADAGLGLAIAGVVLALFGYTFGILIYIGTFYLASRGLNSTKRGRAVAAIVLAVISIIITVYKIISLYL